MSNYTIGDMFAGIGGFSLAGHAAGFRTSWFVEREAFPVKVLNKNFPGVPIYGDVFECHDLPYVDVVTAGFPCQPFSMAGKRLGVNDERYLVPEMLRVIDEIRPLVCIFENVPGFANIADGHTFREFLRALAEMGFYAQWGHLRASDAGAPHQRERWFCVAYRTSEPRYGVNHHVGNGMAREPQSEFRNDSGSPALADAISNRWQTRIGFRSGHATIGTLFECQPKWCGQSLADTADEGLSQPRQTQRYPGYQESSTGSVTGLERRSRTQLVNTYRQHGNGRRFNSSGLSQFETSGVHISQYRPTQSRVGRDVARLPVGLDGHRWPARPGEPQHDYEPARVTSEAVKDRAARLKALGNSIVPQVVYPIFLAVREYLDAMQESEAA